MAATTKPVIVVPGTPLTTAQRCTTVDCNEPRIRMNALKCTAHEIVYRAAAKARATARKAAAAKAAKVATKAAKATKTPATRVPANSGGAVRKSTPPVPAMHVAPTPRA